MIKKIVYLILISMLLCGCQKEDKKIVISKDVAKDVKVEISEAKELMLKARNKLQEKDYAAAKVIFEKIINSDKGNAQNYIAIKDYYLEYKKYDDAYAIIKTAIDSNVDVKGMTSILEILKSNFKKVEIKDSIYRGQKYTLPKEVEVAVNEETIKVPIKWDNEQIDTSEPGNFQFNGLNEQYGKNVVFQLEVKEDVYSKEIGIIKNIYDKDNKTYLDMDLIEFYTGDQAIEEAKNDGVAMYVEELKKYIVPNGYYTRNNHKFLTNYLINDECEYYLNVYDLDSYKEVTNGLITEKVSYDKFIKYINDHPDTQNGLDNRPRLVWIYTKNDVVYKIERQYTP